MKEALKIFSQLLKVFIALFICHRFYTSLGFSILGKTTVDTWAMLTSRSSRKTKRCTVLLSEHLWWTGNDSYQGTACSMRHQLPCPENGRKRTAQESSQSSLSAVCLRRSTFSPLLCVWNANTATSWNIKPSLAAEIDADVDFWTSHTSAVFHPELSDHKKAWKISRRAPNLSRYSTLPPSGRAHGCSVQTSSQNRPWLWNSSSLCSVR